MYRDTLVSQHAGTHQASYDRDMITTGPIQEAEADELVESSMQALALAPLENKDRMDTPRASWATAGASSASCLSCGGSACARKGGVFQSLRRAFLGRPGRPKCTDKCTDEELLALRSHASIPACVKAGREVYLRSPITPISHCDPVSFDLNFECTDGTIGELLGRTLDEAHPLELKLDAKRGLRQMFDDHSLDAKGYHFVPHEIELVSVDNRGVPVGWWVQLVSANTTGSTTEWFRQKTVRPMGDLASEYVAPDTYEADCRTVYVADPEVVCSDAWCRLAGQDLQSLLRDTKNRFLMKGNSAYLEVPLPDAHTTTAPDPVVQLALRNIGVLAQHTESTGVHDYSLQKAVEVDPKTGKTSIVLPLAPTNHMVQAVWKDAQLDQGGMCLDHIKVVLTPATNVKRWTQVWKKGHEMAPHYLKEKFIHLDVRVRMTGVFIKDENRRVQ